MSYFALSPNVLICECQFYGTVDGCLDMKVVLLICVLSLILLCVKDVQLCHTATYVYGD